MQGYDREKAAQYMLAHWDPKALRGMKERLPKLIDSFIEYDLHFMLLTGVVDADGCQGENDYDDDEAFEYIYDAWLSDHPEDGDESMKVAEALNIYMELQYDFLVSEGLAEL